jgi:uncharacterized protein
MTTNIELIQALYAAFRGGDFEAFAGLCTDDLEWIQSPGFPYGGHHRGAQATVDGVFRELPKHWEGWGFDVAEMLDAGTRVIVLGAYRGTHRRTGKSFRAETAHVFDLEGGRVRRFRQYSDTALVRDATEA